MKDESLYEFAERKGKEIKKIMIGVIILTIIFIALIVAILILRNKKPKRGANTTDMTIPAYSGSPYVEVNGNKPYFTDDEKRRSAFETYSDLDELGRCGIAYACVSKELMPSEERGEIGSIKPTGWKQASMRASLIRSHHISTTGAI